MKRILNILVCLSLISNTNTKFIHTINKTEYLKAFIREKISTLKETSKKATAATKALLTPKIITTTLTIGIIVFLYKLFTRKNPQNNPSGKNIRKLKKRMLQDNISDNKKLLTLASLLKIHKQLKIKNIKQKSITLEELKTFIQKIPYNKNFFSNNNFKYAIKLAAKHNLYDKNESSIIESCILHSTDRKIIEDIVPAALQANKDVYNYFNTKNFKKILNHINTEKKIFIDRKKLLYPTEEEEEERIKINSYLQELRRIKKTNKKVYQQLLNRLYLFSVLQQSPIPKKDSVLPPIPKKACAKIVGYIPYNNMNFITKLTTQTSFAGKTRPRRRTVIVVKPRHKRQRSNSLSNKKITASKLEILPIDQ